jgi:hypothetical protein
MHQIPCDDPHGRKPVNDHGAGWFPLQWWQRLRRWFAKSGASDGQPTSHWRQSHPAEGPNDLGNDSSVTLRPGDLL